MKITTTLKALAAVLLANAAVRAQTHITSCPVTLSSSGSYILDNDVSASRGNCITVTASNVTLDANGHSFNSASGGVGVYGSSIQSLTVKNAATSTGIHKSEIDCFTCQYALIQNNTLDVTAIAFGVVLAGGSSNQVLSNTITGSTASTDDLIVLQDESNDTVNTNKLSNFYDAGIEFVGSVTGTTVHANYISGGGTTAYYVGIASYYNTHMVRDVISGNKISGTKYCMQFIYVQSGNGPSQAWSDNYFASNSCQSPAQTQFAVAYFEVDPASGSSNSDYFNNDFGYSPPAPVFSSASAAKTTDDGQNKCTQPGGSYPLTCH